MLVKGATAIKTLWNLITRCLTWFWTGSHVLGLTWKNPPRPWYTWQWSHYMYIRFQMLTLHFNVAFNEPMHHNEPNITYLNYISAQFIQKKSGLVSLHHLSVTRHHLRCNISGDVCWLWHCWQQLTTHTMTHHTIKYFRGKIIGLVDFHWHCKSSAVWPWNNGSHTTMFLEDGSSAWVLLQLWSMAVSCRQAAICV